VVIIEGRDAECGPGAIRAKLARNLLQAGRKLNRRGAGARLVAALGSIASSSARLGVTDVDIGVNLNHGRADSGPIEVDREELIEDLCEALAGNRSGLILPALRHPRETHHQGPADPAANRRKGAGIRQDHNTPGRDR
jgi:hypothetical protein